MYFHKSHLFLLSWLVTTGSILPCSGDVKDKVPNTNNTSKSVNESSKPVPSASNSEAVGPEKSNGEVQPQEGPPPLRSTASAPFNHDPSISHEKTVPEKAAPEDTSTEVDHFPAVSPTEPEHEFPEITENEDAQFPEKQIPPPSQPELSPSLSSAKEIVQMDIKPMVSMTPLSITPSLSVISTSFTNTTQVERPALNMIPAKPPQFSMSGLTNLSHIAPSPPEKPALSPVTPAKLPPVEPPKVVPVVPSTPPKMPPGAQKFVISVGGQPVKVVPAPPNSPAPPSQTKATPGHPPIKQTLPTLSCDQLDKKILKLVRSVDRSLRPRSSDNSPTPVNINAFIRNIYDINEKQKTWTVHFTFRQMWNDPRLEYDIGPGCPNYNFLTLTSTEDIWTPGLYFPKSKLTIIHQDPQPNTMVRVSPNGDVIVSTRYTSTMHCTGSGSSTGEHLCKFVVSSYAYNLEELELKWIKQKPIQIERASSEFIDNPEFSLERLSLGYLEDDKVLGRYRNAYAKFHFMRSVCSAK